MFIKFTNNSGKFKEWTVSVTYPVAFVPGADVYVKGVLGKEIERSWPTKLASEEVSDDIVYSNGYNFVENNGLLVNRSGKPVKSPLEEPNEAAEIFPEYEGGTVPSEDDNLIR